MGFVCFKLSQRYFLYMAIFRYWHFLAIYNLYWACIFAGSFCFISTICFQFVGKPRLSPGLFFFREIQQRTEGRNSLRRAFHLLSLRLPLIVANVLSVANEVCPVRLCI